MEDLVFHYNGRDFTEKNPIPLPEHEVNRLEDNNPDKPKAVPHEFKIKNNTAKLTFEQFKIECNYPKGLYEIEGYPTIPDKIHAGESVRLKLILYPRAILDRAKKDKEFPEEIYFKTYYKEVLETN